MEQKKLDIGWFSFVCSEDSTIIFTELLNDYFEEWKNIFNFKYARFLQKKSEKGPFDIVFIEGALSSIDQEEKVKQIRQSAKKVVAIGACACTGMPSSQRNNFPPDKIHEIQFLLDRFNYSDSVKKIEDVIKVDYKVPGCPMDEKIFLETLDILLKEFGIKNAPK